MSVHFRRFSIVFPNTALFINLKKYFARVPCLIPLFCVERDVRFEPGGLGEGEDAWDFGQFHAELDALLEVPVVHDIICFVVQVWHEFRTREADSELFV